MRVRETGDVRQVSVTHSPLSQRAPSTPGSHLHLKAPMVSSHSPYLLQEPSEQEATGETTQKPYGQLFCSSTHTRY